MDPEHCNKIIDMVLDWIRSCCFDRTLHERRGFLGIPGIRDSGLRALELGDSEF